MGNTCQVSSKNLVTDAIIKNKKIVPYPILQPNNYVHNSNDSFPHQELLGLNEELITPFCSNIDLSKFESMTVFDEESK